MRFEAVYPFNEAVLFVPAFSQRPALRQNAKGRGTPAILSIADTLEDNDEVERVEKEPFDIKNCESGITLLRIRFIRGQPGD